MAKVYVDLGLGGIFRKILIDEDHVVSAWDLREIGPDATARDFVFGKNPGTYFGSGWTKGISVELPEGALGRRFTGTEYVLVSDDGDGFSRPGDATERTLSLRNGGFNVPILFRTSQNDATLRCLAQKQETNSTGNGWHVAIQSGAIEGYLKVGGSAIFNFQRGSGLADGNWHLVDLCYQPATGTGEVRIFIDGVQSGATVTGATTEPATNTGAFRIGMFNDGSGAFIGDISYVMVGRNANATLSAALHATRAWTDVTNYVRAAGEAIEVITGMPGTTLKDRQSGIGTAQFVLSNVSPQGVFTLGHANTMAGFDLQIPVRIRSAVGNGGGTEQILFRGRLKQAPPETGSFRGRRVFCIAEDWFAAARRTVTGIGIQTEIRSDRAWAALVDQADYPPVAVSMTAGSETFPFVFDRVSGPLLTEMAAVVMSEGGYCYIRPDTTTGGVLTFESRGTRQIDSTPDASFNNTMSDLEVELGDEAVINSYRFTITPRDPGDTNDEILYIQERRQAILPMQTIDISVTYQDPTQTRSSVGGTEFQPFTAGTDYTATQNEDGSGASLTSYLTFTGLSIGGSGVDFKVTNTHETDTAWFAFQVRGRGLYTDKPWIEVVPFEEGIRRRGRHEYEESFPYLDSPTTARGLAQLAINMFKDPTPIPRAMLVRPVSGSAKETATMFRGPGDLIAIGEPVSAIATSQQYWVQNARFTFEPPNRLDASFGLFPSYATGDEPIGVWDETEWDECVWGV